MPAKAEASDVAVRDLPGGIRVEVHPTAKFKTILIEARLCADLDGDVTRRALVPNVLLQGTRTSPSLTALTARLEDLYGASLTADVSKVGEWHIAEFSMEIVDGAYLPRHPALFRPSVELLGECLADPAMEDGTFRPAIVKGEVERLGRAIASLVNDKGRYARVRLIQSMCPDEPFRRYAYGDLQDLPGIDAGNLASFWRTWLETMPIAIQIRGDVDPERAIDEVARAFSFQRRATRQPSPAPPPVRPGEPRTVVERMDVSQAKLCLGFRHTVDYADPKLEAMVVANAVLGASPVSRLFQKVRERASLAYSAHSLLERSKKLLIVECGIDASNVERVVEIVRDEIAAIARGEATGEEIDSARRLIANRARMIEDSPSDPLSVSYIWALHGRRFDLDAYVSKVLAVAPDEVAEAASTWALDTIYLLAPEGRGGMGGA